MERKSFKGLKIQVPRNSVALDEDRSASASPSKISYDESACKILPECAKLLNHQNKAAPRLHKISEHLQTTRAAPKLHKI